MVNPFAMTTPLQQWRRTDSAAGRRFGIGLLAALALVLVAFEWRSAEPEIAVVTWLDLEQPIEQETMLMFRKPDPVKERPRARQRSNGPVVPVDDPLPDDPPLVDDPEPDSVHGSGTATDSTSRENLSPPDDAGPMVIPWSKGREDMPYFVDCTGNKRMDLATCTEARIQRHLDRYFRVPPALKGEEFTVVSFEIDAEGRIGRLVCRPTPSAAVEHEVERVVRLLPAFVPGMQNGHPVSVIYQLPLRVKRDPR